MSEKEYIVHFRRPGDGFEEDSAGNLAFQICNDCGALVALFAFEQLVNGWKHGFEESPEDKAARLESPI